MEKYILIPLLPLAAFAINIIFGRSVLKDKAAWISILAVFGSFVLSVMTFADVAAGK
jgi:NADH-quinone oxidoreductase subunit L